MALRIVWTAEARSERAAITRFFTERNGSPNYSKSLAKQFGSLMRLVAKNELIGKSTNSPGVRCLFVLDYSLLYRVAGNDVVVLSIWDNRRNPARKPS